MARQAVRPCLLETDRARGDRQRNGNRQSHSSKPWQVPATLPPHLAHLNPWNFVVGLEYLTRKFDKGKVKFRVGVFSTTVELYQFTGDDEPHWICPPGLIIPAAQFDQLDRMICRAWKEAVR